MDLEIEEELENIYRNMKIKVEYIDLRNYKIRVIIDKDNNLEINYCFNENYTKEYIILDLCNMIDRFIISIYRKGE